MDIKPLLKLMAEKNASDLFFTPMAAIKIKIEGQIMSLGKDLLTVDQVRDAAHSIMNEHQKDVLERELEIDFAISLQGMGRFRANVRHPGPAYPRENDDAQARYGADGRGDRLGQIHDHRGDDQPS
jgi:Tfp pilus assembly ATPase PilU